MKKRTPHYNNTKLSKLSETKTLKKNQMQPNIWMLICMVLIVMLFVIQKEVNQLVEEGINNKIEK